MVELDKSFIYLRIKMKIISVMWIVAIIFAGQVNANEIQRKSVVMPSVHANKNF